MNIRLNYAKNITDGHTWNDFDVLFSFCKQELLRVKHE